MIKRLIKLYQWYVNVLRDDCDWDANSLYKIMEYKLKRVEQALKNGYAEHDVKDLKALRLAIKLAEKLKENRYEDKLYDRHEKKWGGLISWTTEISNENLYQWHSKRPNAITDAEKELERKELMDTLVESQKYYDRDRRIFFDIMQKYMNRWWD